MEDKIIQYAFEHPVLVSIIIPIVLGVIASFVSEGIQRSFFSEEWINQITIEKQKRAAIVFRLITLAVALVLAVLALAVLVSGGVIKSWSLGGLFILLNASVPFAFYHLKGRLLVELIINKLFSKVKKVKI